MRLSVSALDPRRLRRREVPLTEVYRLSAAMMTAPVAVVPRADANAPDLTTSWERVVGNVPSAPAAPRPARGLPYPDFAATQVAAYRRALAPETAPIPKIPASPQPPPPAVHVTAPAHASSLPRHGRIPQAEVPDAAVLRQVRDGMLNKWQAQRTEAFLADKRELPVFAAVTKEVGWLGLHMPPKRIGWRYWSTRPWAVREDLILDAACKQARAELDAVHARYAAQALAAEAAA